MIDYFNRMELGLCLRINACSRKLGLRRFFTAVSRLGDWPAYAIVGIACAALLEDAGWAFVLQSVVTAGIGIVAYRGLKQWLVRERPYVTHEGIIAATAALDRYSFPSGHTLHAVSFAIIYASSVPAMAWIMVPFAMLVAASRVVLGLHYPTDVVAGAILGAVLGFSSMGMVS